MGRKAIVSTAFGTVGNPMFDDPPGCFLHKQGNFITRGFFPEDVRRDIDSQGRRRSGSRRAAAGDKPMLGGGDLAALFTQGRRATSRRCWST